ncbi:outer membrane biosynthesis protein TonB [Erythromicrobium ramosum]|uniref:Outer membrane biosynthesis protein TonB n=1 Tax=Erythrobacter ramosus TaxID=35811 RepID=A0ABR6HZI8_9SPHN|nr:hypothetical protein [Erythrobacter ramosus]MBB3776076.1 outer membrane biosynthesis protein TonB [Erythrobacter ramosus]
MKFIKLHSRGGNYLVVASNIAWLRSAENGQTNVGMVGGQPLLVVGSIEEVAEQILNATADREPLAAAPAPAVVPEAVEAPAPPPAVAAPPEAEPVREIVATDPEPVAPPPAPAPSDPEPVAASPEPIAPPAPEPVAEEPEPEPVATARAPVAKASARPRPVPRNSASLWERPAAPTAAQGLKIKAGSQRMMGRLE